MLDRRTFSLLLGSLGLSAPGLTGAARAASRSLPFYDAIGPDLTHWDLDAAGGLTRRDVTHLPANVQYAWPHPSHRFLYVASSNGIPGPVGGGYGATGSRHFAHALRVGADGALSPHGEPLHLTARPIHISIHPNGGYVLIAYNNPGHVTVHRLNRDATFGAEIPQPEGLDFGVYAHQVRVTPSGKSVVLMTRGNDATAAKPEDAGAIKLFTFQDGRLGNMASIAPANESFGPRHLDFHPTLPLAYASLERQNSMWVYGLTKDGGFTPDPLFRRMALIDPDAKSKYPGQGAGPIHVHPNGRFVYQTNRGSGVIDYNGQKVWNGGENNIVVYALDGRGEPTIIQHIDAHGFETRTFVITPDGKTLIAASQVPMQVRDGDAVHGESAGLAIYRIGSDGKLTFVRKQDVDTSGGTHFWCGLLTMP